MAEGVYGLSGSGMDIDAMVEKMMNAKKTSYNKVYQQKVRMEWKKDAYQDVYQKISDYRTDVFDNYMLTGKLSTKKVSVSSSNANKTVLSATANADAANLTHTVDVTQLAQNASIASKSPIGLADDADKKLATLLGGNLSTGLSITLSDDKTGATYESDEERKKHTKTINYTAEELQSKTIYDLVNDINKSGLNIKASYDSNLDRIFINNKSSGAENQVTLNAVDEKGAQSALGAKLIQKLANADARKVGFDENGTRKLTELVGDNPTDDLNLTFGEGADAKTLHYTAAELATKTIDDLVHDINRLGVPDLEAAYYADSDRMTILNSTTGAEFTVKATDDATPPNESVLGKKLLNGIKYDVKEPSSITTNLVNKGTAANPDWQSDFIAGQDAKVNIDGMELTQKSNTFTVAGVAYTLQDTGTARVQVNTDTDAAVDTVTKFVESYNKMLETLKTVRDEKYYSDYPPLTTEQKEEMSEDEIKKWEEKSKSGLLRNDTVIKKLVSDMRYATTTGVLGITGKYNSLASLGITSKSYLDGGKLYIDETKLKKALADDPDALNDLFTASGSSKSENGIARRLNDSLKEATEKIADTAGTPAQGTTDTTSSIARQLKEYKNKMSTMQDRLDAWRKSYYNKFNAMEVALANMNNQMSFLTQASGGQ